MKKNSFYLVSVKPKNSQAQGHVYVVAEEDIASFVKETLDGENVLLIDSVDSFVSNNVSSDNVL
jgi:adenosyl cobinamide kinase/adenosyl cobinamide phosphate guanylyltransferase